MSVTHAADPTQALRLKELRRQELRQLIALLEQSGMAERRADVRALLHRSRSKLQQYQPRPQRLARKLGAAMLMGLDAGALAALPILAWSLLTEITWAAGTLAGIILGWGLLRLRRLLKRRLFQRGFLQRGAQYLADALDEAGRYALYHLAWSWDWVAEAFSVRAMLRMEARTTAKTLMTGWRQHRRALVHSASPADVEAFLTTEFGPRAGREFARAVEAVNQECEWTLRGGAGVKRRPQRLAALRWTALMPVFAQLGMSGALWAEFAAGSDPADFMGQHGSAQAMLGPVSLVSPGAEDPVETPERATRRADLRDQIRRKRRDITTAFGWKLKTASEITQRDSYLAQTRAEIAALEAELAAVGR